MKKLLMGWLLSVALCAPAQHLTIRDVFKSMPDSLMPYLSNNNRLDFIDFMDSNMKAEVKNQFGGNSIMAEIGIGKASIIKNIDVKWPHFTKEIASFENVNINQTIKIIEGSSSIEILNLPKTPFKNNTMDMHHHNH